MISSTPSNPSSPGGPWTPGGPGIPVLPSQEINKKVTNKNKVLTILIISILCSTMTTIGPKLKKSHFFANKKPQKLTEAFYLICTI